MIKIVCNIHVHVNTNLFKNKKISMFKDFNRFKSFLFEGLARQSYNIHS